MTRPYLILSFFFTFAFSLTNQLTNAVAGPREPLNIPEEAQADILGWREFRLGEDRSQVIDKLSNNYLWLIPKDPYEEDIPDEMTSTAIEMEPNDFLKRLQFQFNAQEKLFMIRMLLARQQFGFLQLYNSMKEKYGEAQEVKFNRVVWRKGERSLTLERNNSVKYYARDVSAVTNRTAPEGDFVQTEIEVRKSILEGL